jgi:methylated-DNA-protein-cysteine methyltransferase-like protein
MQQFIEQIYALVRLIPSGKVLTYGTVAHLLDRPRNARAVGWALRNLPDGSDVPWHRVINSQRKISFRNEPDNVLSELIQRELLEAEGIRFDAKDRVPRDAVWIPSIWEIRDRLCL